MCGICGIFEFGPENHSQVVLERMTKALLHRGPDDGGIYLNGPIGLGHRRLSIIDLSDAGHQPMVSTDGRYWIVYNGEIYNYQEIRSRLQSSGFSFQTQTDTEVILAAYAVYGVDCLHHFNGMWAFAIWDQQKQELFCSRDRLGIKPFYYYQDAERFVFASELKSLLKHPAVPSRLDEKVCYQYLRFAQTNLGNESFFRDLRQLEPAHYLIVRNGKEVVKGCFWALSNTVETVSFSQQEAAERFKEIFTDSIRLRLRSDVPIGTCLSGGLDSSSIVCLAHNLSLENPDILYQQQTFSSCFEEKIFDEREFIEMVLSQTGAQRNFLFPNPNVLLEDIQALVYTQDEPFGSLSIFAQWCVMRTAKRAGVTVLLDGQGADELLAGYGYDSVFWAELFQGHHWADLGPEIGACFKRFGAKTTLKRFGRMLMPRLINHWDKLSAREPGFIADDFKQSYHSQCIADKVQVFEKHLKNSLYAQLDTSLAALLRYEDRNSMAFSLESRVPFLDYRLVEYIFSLPSTFIIHQGWSKWVLRQAMVGILPEKIRWRQDKMGFVTPQEFWYKNELKPFILEVLNDPRFLQRPFWNGKEILKAYENFLQRNDSTIKNSLWRFICMELWLRWIYEVPRASDV